MAEARRFTCGNCRRAVEAWSDGNPYYLDETGTKRYAYHPDHARLARCIGNDLPHLCLACGTECMADTRTQSMGCPGCGGGSLVDTFHLEGQACPFCKGGKFRQDPDFLCIS